ncbi:carbon-phosphorus lyase complex subunit PhnI [Phascolarctobacterium sp.]|uniref:carbon-phosphorus lyase complex subunit PhnI n=1 Tax=Phascolarctobacterium sp. TaxID=2049039 RepID=UPI0025DC2332|nr:carbon-phosphorus lyase complex subunit PhnI [uncultured Phascolarctobacterium sp.]
MAYVAVSGGQEAIEESIRLLHCLRGSTFKELDIEAIEKKLSLLVDRVMSEAGLYAPVYAALALKQAEGSIEEAVFLLRAYRSTLSRNYYTLPASGADMRAVRRISAAFKDIQGGQILGATYDYTHRLIEFKQPAAVELCAQRQARLEAARPVPVAKLPRVSDYLKQEGLIDTPAAAEDEPVDVTKNVLEFPCERSARLQTLARADGGFVGGLAYSSIRGYGAVHPTVGELRCGYVELEVPYLFDENETICIGEILLTEVEGFIPEDDDKKLKLAVGYGAVFGRNENKAIAMAVLDASLETAGTAPTQDEEFVLLHGDSLEMNGFISHLKLPHYVTFQSKLDSVRKTRKEPSHES